MSDQPPQHVQIENADGITVYSTGFWPGWYEFVMLQIAFVIISGLFAGCVYLVGSIENIYAEFFNDILGVGWLYDVLYFLIAGMVDLSFITLLGLLVLWIPYFFMYQLSPKRFWIKDDVLHHTAYLLGFIPHIRRIAFEQILDVEAEACNGRHAVKVLYERNLPKLIFIILVYWNEKLTQWSLTLVNGIPAMNEAQKIQNTLLEPMTDSDICRVEKKS